MGFWFRAWFIFKLECGIWNLGLARSRGLDCLNCESAGAACRFNLFSLFKVQVGFGKEVCELFSIAIRDIFKFERSGSIYADRSVCWQSLVFCEPHPDEQFEYFPIPGFLPHPTVLNT